MVEFCTEDKNKFTEVILIDDKDEIIYSGITTEGLCTNAIDINVKDFNDQGLLNVVLWDKTEDSYTKSQIKFLSELNSTDLF